MGGEGRLNLAHEFFIGEVLKRDSGTRAFCVAEAISFAKNGVDHGLLALCCLPKLNGAIGAGFDAGAAAETPLLIYHTNRAGCGDGIMGEQRDDAAGCPVSLADRFGNMLGIMGHAAKKNAVSRKLDRS